MLILSLFIITAAFMIIIITRFRLFVELVIISCTEFSESCGFKCSEVDYHYISVLVMQDYSKNK